MTTTELTGLAHRTLGHYQLVRETGRGGMSIVYEAVDTRLRRTVALKILHPPTSSLAGKEEMVARMEREARAIASLSHPNVITIYDVGEQDGLHYLATEYLDGITLRERLHQGTLTPEEATDILRQVAEGLDAVHRQGVLHRDIKPSNIMLLYNGRVKLLDFGIARFANDSTLTQIGSMVGSPSYMAPELLNGGKAMPASDIWALGVLLFEMLSNRLPFEADSMGGIMYHILYDAPMPLPNASPEIADVLHQALNKSSSERFPTARALADAFAEAAAAPPRVKVPMSQIEPESGLPPPTVQEEIPASPSEENTLLAPIPIVPKAKEPVAVPVSRQPLPSRRNRVLPTVLALAAVMIVAVLAHSLRSPASHSAQRTVPNLAAKGSAKGTKTASLATAPSPVVAKTTHLSAGVSANKSPIATEKPSITRTVSVRTPTARASSLRLAATKRVGKATPPGGIPCLFRLRRGRRTKHLLFPRMFTEPSLSPVCWGTNFRTRTSPNRQRSAETNHALR